MNAGGSPSTGATGGEPTDEELASLQAAVLESVLRGAPLPGSTEPVSLPDLAFLPATGATPLARAHLARRLVAAPPADVRLVGDAADEPDGAGAAGYLQFSEPRTGDGVLRLNLEVWLAPGDGVERAHPLGGVQLGFRRSGSGWQLAEPPQAFAT